MFSPVAMFHVVGSGAEASSPLAFGPRYWGYEAAETDRVAARSAAARTSG
jgi:hypothetical protein